MYLRVTSKKELVILFAGMFLLLTVPHMGRAQSLDNFVQDDYQHKINLYDVYGHPIGNDAIETKGSPLFVLNWKQGWLRLADGRFFTDVPLKLDLEKQVVHYRRADGTDIEVQPGQVKELAVLDTVAGHAVVYQFSCGFQPIDNQSETSFYLVLDSGKVSVLESMQKKMKSEKDDFSGETHRGYELRNDFYVISGRKMERIRRDAKFFLELTWDKHGLMEDYLQKTKVNFRSMDDIRRFIDYYNGLP